MAGSLADVDFEELKRIGVKYIAFDADSTLVQFRGKQLSDETKALLKSKRHLFENWCIASNRITNDLLPLAESMDAQVVRATILVRKPKELFFKWVMAHFGTENPAEVAMIGDKLIADMFGAKRAGFVTVWVEKIGPDIIWDRAFQVRRWERKLMQKYLPENSKK